MSLTTHTVGLDRPYLPHLSRWLLANAPRGERGDLSGVLVLLPAKRPCESFKQCLIEQSDRRALLLPDVTTPIVLTRAVAERLNLRGDPIPPDWLRANLLARHLAHPDPIQRPGWLRSHPESVPGIAEELIALFDQARLHGQQGALLSGGGRGDVADTIATAAGEIFLPDLQRIRQAWELYRQVVPLDSVERRLQVDRAIRSRRAWPGPPFELVVMAGFTSLDAVTAALLRAVMGQADFHLFQIGADDPVSRLFLASYGNETAATHPLRPSRAARDRLTGDRPDGAGQPASADTPATETSPTYRDRLHTIAKDASGLDGAERIQMLAFGDPELESRGIAALVVQEIQRLAETGDRIDGRLRIAVATEDRKLARRVVAQLRDAGIRDVDDTAGQPLGEQPAGLLCHHLLATVVTDFQHGPFLELLTHPFVTLGENRDDHERLTQYLERLIRGEQRPRGGLQSYRFLAANQKKVLAKLRHVAPEDLTDFLARIEQALEPLIALRRDRRASHAAWLSGLRRTWQNVAPGQPLREEDQSDDLARLAKLLSELKAYFDANPAGAAAPDLDLGEFNAFMSDLLGKTAVRPRRGAFHPVQVTGLIEARLEHYDLLILAGMSEDVFPGRIPRPLFLNDKLRQTLGLPGWRDRLAEDAELFLRLIHNGAAVVITWPQEKLGDPCLPSPLVVRLNMSGLLPCAPGPPAPLYRRPQELPDAGRIRAAQREFAAELPTEIPVLAAAPATRRLSHTGIKTYRDCPYRFLLERGYGLTEEEQVVEEFRRLDFGNRVHDCLCRYLKPGGKGQIALAAGDRKEALAQLEREAAAAFDEGANELPQRRLWEEAFLQMAPAVADFELARFAAGWRPTVLEGRFALSLAEVAEWLLANERPPDDERPLPDLNAAAGKLSLVGKIDRIDLLGDDRKASVIDYKTGQIPNVKAVTESRELQIVMYALAVEAGGVELLPADGALEVVQGAYYRLGVEQCGFSEQRPHLAAGGAEGRGALWRGALEVLLAALAAADRERSFPLIPEHWRQNVPGRLPCGICPFHGVCRLEERRLPDHLEVKLRKELTASRNE